MADRSPHLDFVVDPPLDAAQRRRLVAIWVDVANAAGAVGFIPPVTPEMVEPVADISYRRVLGGLDHIVVALIDGNEIGFAFLEQRPGTLFRHWATVRRLQIHPGLQGQGYGRALVEAVHQAARDLDLEQLHLHVRAGTGAEDFYSRHGYEVVATIPEAVRVGPGDDRDEIYMIAKL